MKLLLSTSSCYCGEGLQTLSRESVLRSDDAFEHPCLLRPPGSFVHLSIHSSSYSFAQLSFLSFSFTSRLLTLFFSYFLCHSGTTTFQRCLTKALSKSTCRKGKESPNRPFYPIVHLSPIFYPIVHQSSTSIIMDGFDFASTLSLTSLPPPSPSSSISSFYFLLLPLPSPSFSSFSFLFLLLPPPSPSFSSFSFLLLLLPSPSFSSSFFSFLLFLLLRFLLPASCFLLFLFFNPPLLPPSPLNPP
jgi:hypothetical protein